MNTPIYDFLQKYSESGTVRAHMPGHKGKSPFDDCGFGDAFGYDITEIKGADSLFEADGIIAESEKNASVLFGTAATFFSAGGSTLCIQTMLAAVCNTGGAVICGRNSHRSVINACVLLDLEPCWIYPDYQDGSAVSGKITAEAVREAIKEYAEKKPSCVFMTSPDYLGQVADIKAIAEVCHDAGLPLLVDNAHGAYLAFLEKSLHPIALGADMCCDSAHKTLPVLTGGAYLHMGNEKYIGDAKRCMALFGSTSPSYLIMASMDLCNKYLAEDFQARLKKTIDALDGMKERLSPVYTICPSEPLKLSIYALPCGLTGYELADRLRENGTEPEYADGTHVVMMFSPAGTEEDLARTETALQSVRMPRIFLEPPLFEPSRPERAMSPRKAFFAEKESVPIEKSVGRVAAESVTVCPPCVPAVASGEVIDENVVKILKMYSIFSVNVVK
ncbi:MAG: aminotransferase class I/II-fold pyridoxal phosphate-dependent enzyme [Oscillospiraceae bacterium]|nr:aminotransferase class I/II-fold pyridoxal phosphate-dependent enzyme [Oscillospiraceae bacterium]